MEQESIHLPGILIYMNVWDNLLLILTKLREV